MLQIAILRLRLSARPPVSLTVSVCLLQVEPTGQHGPSEAADTATKPSPEPLHHPYVPDEPSSMTTYRSPPDTLF